MNGTNSASRVLATILILVLTAAAAWSADDGHLDPLAIEGAVASAFAVQPATALTVTRATPQDWAMVRDEDESRENLGLAPRFAIGEDVWLTPENVGTWEDLNEDYLLWRTRLTAPGALSINLGFTGYWLPPGARLGIHPTDITGPDDRRGQPVFTANDNADHGELWTPVILADDIVVELVIPRSERYNYRLELTALNQGYRFFGEPEADKAGTCNIDVVCPEGDDWRQEINAVGAISTGGRAFCTGVMMNNTAQDGKPYFLTANHCGITSLNVASLVVYWNYQSVDCNDQSGGPLDQFSTGARFLANSSALPAPFKSDFTLVELDQPVDPTYGVTFAGWSRSTADPTSATTIHHPRGDEKSISFETDPTTTTTYLQTLVPGDGTHIRVTDWDLGTTEPGSSGGPLFDQNHHVVGQLHGGFAACGNDDSDWYGRFSISWDGGGTPTSRLRDYLDPLDSDVMSLDLLDPNAESFAVTSAGETASTGVVGGPFLPADHQFTVANSGGTVVEFVAAVVDADWLELSSEGATLAVGESAELTATISSQAAALSVGNYVATISFVNPSGGGGTTSREVTLQVTENAFTLIGPVPNPFTSIPVEIRYTLRGPTPVQAIITNMRGMLVRDLGRFTGQTGENTIEWNGRDDHGHRAPSGTYAVKLEALGQTHRFNLSYIH